MQYKARKKVNKTTLEDYQKKLSVLLDGRLKTKDSMDAIGRALHTTEKLANEMNDKIYMTVDEQEAASSELQMLGIASWDDVAYPTGSPKYMVYTTKNGWPVISFMREGGGSDREKGAYYMTQDMLDSFNASGKSKVLLQGIEKLPDGSPPEGALDDFSQQPIKFIGIQ